MMLLKGKSRLPDVQCFAGKVKSATNDFRSYFLYDCAPCHWRENWRNIAGFSVRWRKRYFMLCVWRKF